MIAQRHSRNSRKKTTNTSMKTTSPLPSSKDSGEGIVICLKCGARGVKKYIFAANNAVKCSCGNWLYKEKYKNL